MSAALYQEMLLTHHRNPIGFEKSIASTLNAVGENVSCGDEIEVEVKLSENLIEDLAFSGDSCAICRASASMMNKTLVGEEFDEVAIIHNTLKHSLRLSNGAGKKTDTLRVEDQKWSSALSELSNLHGLSKLTESEISALLLVNSFPVRVQCAMLPWNTLNEALQGRSK